jgi:predicted RNA-binding protein
MTGTWSKLLKVVKKTSRKTKKKKKAKKLTQKLAIEYQEKDVRLD